TIASIAAILHGRGELARWSKPPGPSLPVAIVQPNVPTEWRGATARVPEILNRLARLTERASASSPRLVVWPENAVGFVASANELPLRAAADALRPGALLLLGARRSALDADGRAPFRNSAFLVDRRGKVLASHDKRRL